MSKQGRKPGHGPAWEGRRQDVIDLAAELFASKGYAATGIAEVGKTVGLGTGALYYYIGSKENLLVEIIERVLVPLAALARRIAALDEPILLRLRLLSEAILELIMERLDHIWVYEHDHRYLSGPSRGQIVRRRDEFEDIVSDLFREAIDEGAVQNIDPKLAMFQFTNLHSHTYAWAGSIKGLKASDLSAAFCSTIFFGMAQADDGDLEAQVKLFRKRYSGPALTQTW
jgi:AcrR family transcriptional regulator